MQPCRNVYRGGKRGGMDAWKKLETRDKRNKKGLEKPGEKWDERRYEDLDRPRKKRDDGPSYLIQ